MDMRKAWPGPCPLAQVPPPPALPASHLCARIPGHRDSDAQLSSPKEPAARRGRGRRWGGVEAGPEVGRGLGRRDQEAGATGWGGRNGTVLLSRPPTLYNKDI